MSHVQGPMCLLTFVWMCHWDGCHVFINQVSTTIVSSQIELGLLLSL
jgi:hypothetical protein